MTGVHIGEDVVTTASLQTAMWSIPYQAQDPERSMMLLNLMYTDADFFNTLNWGIEGIHFVKTDDGHITFPDGVDANSSGWYLNLGWVFGNSSCHISGPEMIWICGRERKNIMIRQNCPRLQDLYLIQQTLKMNMQLVSLLGRICKS